MAEFLVKAISYKMPTLTEYKDIIKNKWIPKAQAFPYSKADLISAKTNAKRYMDYRWALTHGNRPEAQTIINKYEADPVSQARIIQIKDIIKKKNHIEQNFKIMTVERYRTDADLTAWLAEKDKRGCYKKGDFVIMRSNGVTWGTEEHPLTQTRFNLPRFFILKVPDLDMDLAKKYIEPETEQYTDDDGDLDNRVVMCRKWHLLVNNLSQTVKDTIQAEGEYTTTFNQLKPYVRDKVTGQTEA